MIGGGAFYQAQREARHRDILTALGYYGDSGLILKRLIQNPAQREENNVRPFKECRHADDSRGVQRLNMSTPGNREMTSLVEAARVFVEHMLGFDPKSADYRNPEAILTKSYRVQLETRNESTDFMCFAESVIPEHIRSQAISLFNSGVIKAAREAEWKLKQLGQASVKGVKFAVTLPTDPPTASDPPPDRQLQVPVGASHLVSPNLCGTLDSPMPDKPVQNPEFVRTTTMQCTPTANSFGGNGLARALANSRERHSVVLETEYRFLEKDTKNAGKFKLADAFADSLDSTKNDFRAKTMVILRLIDEMLSTPPAVAHRGTLKEKFLRARKIITNKSSFSKFINRVFFCYYDCHKGDMNQFCNTYLHLSKSWSHTGFDKDQTCMCRKPNKVSKSKQAIANATANDRI